MKNVFSIWDAVYFPYFIVGFLLLFRFAKKSHALKEEVNHFEGVLIMVLWPIFYWIYTVNLRKRRLKCQEPSE